jgi:hypothetical protein
MTRPAVTTGDHPLPASRGVTQYYADTLNSFQPGSQTGRALLKRGYLAQALIDSTAVLFCFLFLIMIVLSVPLAILLLLVAEF